MVVIDRERLIRKLGVLSPTYLLMLKEALEYTLQLDGNENTEQL
jgi:mRNA interferase MazF